MPSKTPKQARTMAAAAHNPKFAAKVGIPVKVAQDFNRADQRAQHGQSYTKGSNVHKKGG